LYLLYYTLTKLKRTKHLENMSYANKAKTY